MTLARLNATNAAAAIRSGEVSSEGLVRDCLERIGEFEDTVQAWAHLDPDYALRQAREADTTRQSGHSIGSLHGLPVGVKDIFDTEDMPTEDGTILHSGRTPEMDSTVVSLLREAGAIILGKTVTTELAVYSPGKTRNPHDPERTPGGSSSGSAAAVAALMVPLAVGSQTNGSVIRPASFCGVFGFKPTHGLISRRGVLRLSRQLDQVGVFARSIGDLALIAETLMAFDHGDPDMRPRSRPGLIETAAMEPPVTPRLAFIRTPVWDQADEVTKEAFGELVEYLGENAEEVELPEFFDEAVELHRTIMEADLAWNFRREYESGKDRLSAVLREMIERGQKTLAFDYAHALDRIEALNGALEWLFEGYDGFLTPAATGEAPIGLESTGNPAFCSLWTLCGVPAVSVPILQSASGLPIGAQLVSTRGGDARLLRTARWLVARSRNRDAGRK